MHLLKHFFIIVNYNSGNNILSSVQSILQSRDIHPHIIIIDNASRDNSLEECRLKYPGLIYIYNTHNIGFASAANLGARYALERNASTITFCNPDAVLSENCASLLIHSVMEKNIGIASPLIFRNDTTIWFASGKIDFLRCRTTHSFSLKIAPSINYSTDYITGCVMTVHADVLKKIGLFDERFFLYYEDADLSLRAKKAHFTLGIVTSAKAFHKEISENTKDAKTYFLVLSGLLFFQKHAHGLYKLWFLLQFNLRKIKNHFDRNKKLPLAQSVYKAFCDYESFSS